MRIEPFEGYCFVRSYNIAIFVFGNIVSKVLNQKVIHKTRGDDRGGMKAMRFSIIH